MPIRSCAVFDCSSPTFPVPVGRFELDASGNGRFSYNPAFVQTSRAFALDPIRVPIQHLDTFVPRQGDDSFGVFSDAGPNAWGKQLTIKLLLESTQSTPQNAVEWFLSSVPYGSGCLGYSRDPHLPPLPTIDIQSSRSLSARVMQSLDAYTKDPASLLDVEVTQLLLPGSALGGVRPKTLVMHEGSEHIAKFGRPDDLFDVPAAEYATLRLATKAGIDVPSFELISISNRPVLLIERFDRSEGQRIHYASAHSLLAPQPLSADGREYVTSFSYAGIAEVLRPYGQHGQADARELFRRMILNIMVGNVDDHLRNHAFLMDKPGQYRLSPVFDILPHLEAPSRPQSIGVGAYGPASTIANALSQCDRFLLTKDDARTIISEVKDVASNWRPEFRDAGASAQDIRNLASSFSIAEQADRVQIPADAGAYMQADKTSPGSQP